MKKKELVEGGGERGGLKGENNITATQVGRRGIENNELKESTERSLLFDDDEKRVTVSVSSKKVKTVRGEVDMDLSCLLFDESGNYRETVFWDNLSSKGIEHKGDEKLDDDENEEESGEEKSHVKTENLLSTENIEVIFSKLERDITHLVFVLNIFNNKTFVALSNITFTVTSRKRKEKENSLTRYTVPFDKLKKMRDNNALIVAKIYRKPNNNDWFVKVISSSHTIPSGQLVDILVPTILRDGKDEQIVEPLIATWQKIVIEVIAGKSLIVEDLNGRSDPYVKVVCGRFKRKTGTSKSTLNPKWDCDNLFEVTYEDSAGVKDILFLVKDRDRIGKNDYLGQFVVNIAKIPLDKPMNRWFRLQPHSSFSSESPRLPENNGALSNSSFPNSTPPKGKESKVSAAKTDRIYGSINIKLHKYPVENRTNSSSSSLL